MSSGDPAARATIAGVTKMPEPTMPPITIMVASNGPMRRASAGAPSRISQSYHGSAWRLATAPGPPPVVTAQSAGACLVPAVSARNPHLSPAELSARSERMPARLGTVIIENVQPQVDGGRYPVKRAAGETVRVTADVFKEGHDELAVVLRWRQLTPSSTEPREVTMRPLGNDAWEGEFPLFENGLYGFT